MMFAGLVAGLVLPADTVPAVEETVQMAFEKTMGESTAPPPYTVQRGDRLLSIIRKRTGGTVQESFRKLEEVRRLNPGIKNVHVIYPGQRIVLPHGALVTPEKKDVQGPAKPPVFDGKKTREYTVKPGDTVIAILRRELGISHRESLKIIDLMRRLNPGMSDMGRIYPGQALVLPVAADETREERTVGAPEASVKKEAAVSVQREKLLPLFSKITGHVGGTMIMEGIIYIPVRPSGQVTLDTAIIPLIEYKSGKKVLLDIQGQMPGNLRQIIESSWPGYSVLQLTGGGDVTPVIEKLIGASELYTVEKVYGVRSLADGLVAIPVDWLVVKRGSGGDDAREILFGIRFVKSRNELLPWNIADFAEREGFEVVEIEEGAGLAPGGENFGTAEGFSLKGNSEKELAASLLAKLGYQVQRDVKVQLFSIEKEGFNLSIIADIEIDEGGRRCLVVFDSLPGQFMDILSERNIIVVSLPADCSRREVIEKVLGAAGISSVSDTFSFPFSLRKDAKGGAVTFRGIRIRHGEAAWCFVENEIDPALRGFLRKNGEVEIVTY